MFSFIKKLKAVYEVPEPLSVRERALKVFSNIEGLDDIKEMMLWALDSPERAHTLLVGPPACAKSLFILRIEKYMPSKVYFVEGSSTSKAGLQRFIAKISIKRLSLLTK